MSGVRRRGKSKNGAMVHVGLRLPRTISDYFKQAVCPSVEMRRVLEEYVKKELDKVNVCDNVSPQ